MPLCDNTPKGHPFGRTCNPNLPLPTAPPSSTTLSTRLSDECPASAEFGSCAGYLPDLRCKYNHIYTGCTWESLSCTPIMDCKCDQSGSWACMSRSMPLCDNTPKGHPFGRTCNPNLPLPTAPPSSTTLSTRLSDECPASAEFGSCAGYLPDLRCKYNHIYTGCTWESLSCTPIMDCKCDQSGSWACMSRSMLPCDNTPEDHPFGTTCNPNLPLPTAPPSPTLTVSTGVMAKAKAQNEKAMRWISQGSALP